MANVEIKVTDENGSIKSYTAIGSLYEIVWDGFLTAQYQDEQWSDKDTCELIVKKLKGEIPINYISINNTNQ